MVKREAIDWCCQGSEDGEMRVISFVPSWTETLIECGVDVVGRTRFCIHPEASIQTIPVWGGTKDLKGPQITGDQADLVILDREENPKEFLRQIEVPVIATHVDSISTMGDELQRLGQTLRNSRLLELAERARVIAAMTPRSEVPLPMPGLLEELSPYQIGEKINYVIWRNPWMLAGQGTYISSVLQKLGFQIQVRAAEKYPKCELPELSKAYNLFSSEPFPFARKTSELLQLGLRGAVIDGESYSWFGIRGLNFLQQALQK